MALVALTDPNNYSLTILNVKRAHLKSTPHKVHVRSLWELYLNVLTNQITLYKYIKLACGLLKSSVKTTNLFGIFLYQRGLAFFVCLFFLFLKAFKVKTC